MSDCIFIQRASFWKPPLDAPTAAPKLAYVDALFKRRLSQISRMTIEVVHGVQDAAPGAKLVFASYRGEITRQLKINRGLVEDRDVLPAQFSLSVFNTPPAVATIALGLKAGYTAVYPSQAAGASPFRDAVAAACAPLLAGREKQVLFAYADEQIPADYAAVLTEAEKRFVPFAFAVVLGTEQTAGAFPLPAALGALFARGAGGDRARGGVANDSGSGGSSPNAAGGACGADASVKSDSARSGVSGSSGDKAADGTSCDAVHDGADADGAQDGVDGSGAHGANAGGGAECVASAAYTPEAFLAYLEQQAPAVPTTQGAAHE